jgi:hypothetical protein
MRLQHFCVLVFLFAVGCGGPKFAPVSGVVMFNGKPLVGGVVSFQPMHEKGENAAAPGSTGKTNDKGEYSLKGVQGENGALVGKHKVRITAADNQSNGDTDAPPSKSAATPREKIPQIYNSQTTLEAMVKSSDNKLDFTLTGSGVLPTDKASGGDARK